MATALSERTYAVIMAGGSGTRFWPASRSNRPKQLLPLVSEESMLRTTLAHVAKIAAPERTVIVTAERLHDATLAESGLPEQNILLEPIARNTAPCLAWAAAVIAERDPDAVIAVFAADHHIANPPEYHRVLQQGVALADRGHIVTVGITPTRAETGYGYLELDFALDGVEVPTRSLKRFVEKPSRDVAETFVQSGNYAWNSGQFFFRADRFLSETQAHLPQLSHVIAAMQKARFSPASVAENFPKAPNISVDHGVMEKASGIVAIQGNFGWSDVGSWFSAWELAEKDSQGNRIRSGPNVYLDTNNSYVEAPKGKAVCLIGVSDLVVVDTGDALLVMPRERAQDVKAATAQLVAQGHSEFS